MDTTTFNFPFLFQERGATAPLPLPPVYFIQRLTELGGRKLHLLYIELGTYFTYRHISQIVTPYCKLNEVVKYTITRFSSDILS